MFKLFGSSSKEPKGPLPNLSLQVDFQEDKVLKPNDTVSGRVLFSTPVPLTPEAIEIALWGKSSVWLRTEHKGSNNSTSDYIHYRDNVPLFTVTFNLLEKAGQMLQPEQQYTFPFKFIIPEGTGINRSGCYKNDADSRWTVQPHHLPPTFLWGQTPGKEIRPDCASITYGVTASLICPGVGVGKSGQDPISATAPFLFQPLNPHLGAPLSVVRYPKTFTLASSTLTGQSSSSIGFRQKLSDKFSSATPRLDFEIGLELPDLLSSGMEFKFRTSFTALKRTDNVTFIPAILFKVLKVDLQDFTFIRAPRDHYANRFMSGSHHKGEPAEDAPTGAYSGSEDTIAREKKTSLNAIPDSKVVQLEEVMVPGEKKGMVQEDSCELWFSARVPGFTPPSFVSFAICRVYRIKVKMGVEIGGKKFEMEAESHVRELGSAP